MDAPVFSQHCVTFLAALVATLRRTSLYPSKHPSVFASIQTVDAALQEALKVKSPLTLSISPEHKILIEGASLGDKGIGSVVDIIPYFKKFDIENLTFEAGVTLQEVEGLILILIARKEELKSAPDINTVFRDRGLAHIKVEQFSYVKIKKDQEVTVGPGLGLDAVKEKMRFYAAGTLTDPKEIESLETEFFALVADEFKKHGKLGASLRAVIKKFVGREQQQEQGLGKLRQGLTGAGCSDGEADACVAKVRIDLVEKPKSRARGQEDGVAPEGLGTGPPPHEQPLQGVIEQLRAELREKEQLLRQFQAQSVQAAVEREKIDSIVHNMADGMVVVDPEGKILMVNATGADLLGISNQDVGKPLREVVKDEHLLALVKGGEQGAAPEAAKDVELVSPDEATRKVVRASSAVVQDNNGKTIGMVAVLNDVTRQKELERLKSNFVANVTHELRTPLIAIQKSMQLVLEKATGPLTGDQEQFLTIAERNVKRLTLLINDLLDLSKLEAGKMTMNLKSCSIEKIIEETVAGLKEWARSKAITLEHLPGEGIPDVRCDPDRITQVLVNLIGNALKFTPAQGKISVSACRAQDASMVAIRVKDTGIGIAPEHLQKIFNKFYQVGERISADMAGTGIGLSVAKEIIELHKGTISVESEREKGSTFTFTLPVHTV